MILGLAISRKYDVTSPQIAQFVQAAENHGFSCVLSQSGQAFDILVTFGGDGATLHFARTYLDRYPVLAVKLGSLGFLSQVEANLESYNNALARLKSGDYNVIKRALICAKDISGKEAVALNEIMLCNADRGRAISVEAFLEGVRVNKYVGDGVIIATPTGSTAISLSAGGAVLTEDCPCFTLKPHAAMGSCPQIVYSQDRELFLKIGRGESVLYADGISAELNYKEGITVQKYHKEAAFVRFEERLFEKLNSLNSQKDKL